MDNNSENARKKLLVVDDIEVNRLILLALFEEQFDVLEAGNGLEALEYINKYGEDIAVVLLDLVMPVMDGFEVLEKMNQTGIIKSVPVIMITGETDDDKTLTGYNLGVSDLVNKPFNQDIVIRRVNNVADLYAHKHNLEQKLDEQRKMLEKQAEKIAESNQFVIEALAATIESRSRESGDHVKRMCGLTRALLQKAAPYYNIPPEEIEGIANAAILHDIGKVAIPDQILLKPGPFTPEERAIMETHTIRGCEILDTLTSMKDQQLYKYCYEICRHHHERWDGNGYPDKLKGDEISIWAQAASLADVFDALQSKRVYKGPYSNSEAVDMIVNGKCGVFNPRLLEIFLEVQDELDAIFRQFNG